MDSDKGYIYIITSEKYDFYNVCLLGTISNDKDIKYLIEELKIGKVSLLFEVSIHKLELIERLVKQKFKDINFNIEIGNEFFKKRILEHLEYYLQFLNEDYRKLSDDEIKNFINKLIY